MDKPEILERIRAAILDINATRPTFAAAGLHGLENELTHDVAAEAEVRRSVVVNGETVTPTWEMAAKRCRIKCKRLRAERDAAREHIAKQATVNSALRCEVADLRLDRDEHKKWNADFEDQTARLQRELDAAVEHCDRVCGERNRLKDELAKVREYITNSESEVARDITARVIADQNAVIDAANAEIATLNKVNENLSLSLGASRKHHAALADKYNERVSERDRLQHELDAAMAAANTRDDIIVKLGNDLAELEKRHESLVDDYNDRVQERDEFRDKLFAAQKNVRPPSDYSDLVAENARLRNTIRETREITNKVTTELNAEREAHLQLQVECDGLTKERDEALLSARKARLGYEVLEKELGAIRGVNVNLRATADHLRLLLEREEKASGRVSEDLWAMRKATGGLCELIGVPAADDQTDEETAQAVAQQCCRLLEALGIPLHTPQFDTQDEVDAHRVEVERILSPAPTSPTVDLLAAQFAAHRQELNDELADLAYGLESLENRFAALKDI